MLRLNNTQIWSSCKKLICPEHLCNLSFGENYATFVYAYFTKHIFVWIIFLIRVTERKEFLIVLMCIVV